MWLLQSQRDTVFLRAKSVVFIMQETLQNRRVLFLRSKESRKEKHMNNNIILENLRRSAQEIRNRGLITDEEYEKLLAESEVEEQEEVYTCPECGCVVDPADPDVYEIDGDYCCETCCVKCEFCGERVRYEDSVTANLELRWQSEWVACRCCADSHFEECDRCGRTIYGGGVGLQDNRRAICTDCEEDYRACYSCGEIVHIDYGYYHDGTDEWYCEDCYPGDNDSPHINSYANEQLDPDYPYHRRMFCKMNDEVTELYFGIEQEVDEGYNRRDFAEELHRISENGYLFNMKDDGSLGDEGVEIVSCPCSYRYMMECYPFAEIWRISRIYAYKAHDSRNCGLHIHVSRNGLGDTKNEQELVTAKVMILFYRFWEQVVVFSRRGYGNFTTYAKKVEVGDCTGDDEATVIEKSKCQRHDRYTAINITNPHTVEFRVFKGTLNENTVKASIQFVKHLIEFCQVSSLEKVNTISWEELMTTEYEELNEYLRIHSLL